MLQVSSPRDTVAEVYLVRFPVWVQVHGLPLGQTTKAKVEWAPSKVGEVLEVDFHPNGKFRSLSSLGPRFCLIPPNLCDLVSSSLARIVRILGSNLSLKGFPVSISSVVV